MERLEGEKAQLDEGLAAKEEEFNGLEEEGQAELQGELDQMRADNEAKQN